MEKKKLLSNFLFSIYKLKKNWSSKHQKVKLIKDIKKQVNKNKVICALSGALIAALLHNY